MGNFARNKNEAKYPRLWDGLVHCLVPGVERYDRLVDRAPGATRAARINNGTWNHIGYQANTADNPNFERTGSSVGLGQDITIINYIDGAPMVDTADGGTTFNYNSARGVIRGESFSSNKLNYSLELHATNGFPFSDINPRFAFNDVSTGNTVYARGAINLEDSFTNLVYGVRHRFGDNSLTDFFVYGKRKGVSVWTGGTGNETPVTTATTYAMITSFSSYTTLSSGGVFCGASYMWNRRLSDEEMMIATSRPYAVIELKDRRDRDLPRFISSQTGLTFCY